MQSILSSKNNYQDFLKSKQVSVRPSGFTPDALCDDLFEFQSDIDRWALERGRAAIFADCGLGKTPMQLQWAESVAHKLNKPVLIHAPLAVSKQTEREGKKFGIPVKVVASDIEVRKPGVYVTNYEKMQHFDPSRFGGVVLDESSILKSFTGATRNMLIERYHDTPMKLCCTATPSPNDFMELGNHSEFFGVLTRTEMLSTFFVHDGGETSKWRLKGHAEEEYWKWICEWAVMIRKPSDLGYSDEGFTLPKLNIQHHIVDGRPSEGYLFQVEAQTLNERRQARRASLEDRAAMLAQIVAQKPDEPWLIWCDLNDEGDLAEKLIPNSIQVAGRHTDEQKEDRMMGFSEGRYQVLVSKPSIAGYGMNWQHCPNVAFLGLSDSFEMYYQAIRRVWRFGQTREVNCHIITSESEGAVVKNIQRKEADALKMASEMVKHMSVYNTETVHRKTVRTATDYKTHNEHGDGWSMYLGDCVENAKTIADDSIHYSIYSPPFASLYTYSASDRDMGNARTHSEFYEHFRFLIAEQYRAMMPGRLVSFHCMNLPTSKERDGVIGITDFRGDLIRMFREAGFVYHSEVCIWKDPVTAMQRTKALGLLHKQLKKDSCMSRQGIPDYLVTMRKPGENPERVTHTNDTFPVAVWQRYASPVWMDINPSKTLQKQSAREDKDERHICPLQLEVIERAVELWTNPGDLVWSPFAGIGSEGYVALQKGRQFRGDELKESYFRQAVKNLQFAAKEANRDKLFA
jgi:DNA modification methylase